MVSLLCDTELIRFVYFSSDYPVNIHQALSDVADIRAQLNRTEAYRGFRSTAVGISVLVVLAGAIVQNAYAEEPALQIDSYLKIWFVVAAVNICVAGVEMFVRSRISKNHLVNKMHWSLVTQMAPCCVMGFVLTLLISEHAFEQTSSESGLLWALPGLWSMSYALGLFSCQRQLPEQAKAVAAYMLMAGVLLLVLNWSTRTPAAWQMVASFGVGHLLLAGVLYWNVERRDGEEK